MGGPCAVVSAHRLRQEFYGLPPDPELYRQRVIKEAVHDWATRESDPLPGLQLRHGPSHAVEWIDLKERSLCAACQGRHHPGNPNPRRYASSKI